ncbi:MAG TPA: ABC transporter permease [Bryobacteraceae bacterium]|nr:ABC transporter permease [Bryobacteraceae bacterium]
MNTIGSIEAVGRDLRYATRMLRKSVGHTAVAGLSLALGIGASTAIFSVVYGVLISPYPYGRPNEIWATQVRDAKNPRQGWTRHRLSEIVEMRKLPAVADLMATDPGGQLLTGGRTPENFTAISVTANAFQFLEVAPVLGRTILPSDVKASGEAEPVVVLSYKAWQRLFDGSPGALGQTIVLNDVRRTVIGVMPSRFGWWTGDGGWLPLEMDLRQDRMVNDIVRLRPGVSKEVAEQQLQALHVRFALERPKDYPREGFTTGLLNYMDITVASGEMHSSLTLLFAAVGFLLLIACANVANLQLARGTARAREIAVRMSVGAGRGRVLRQLLTESVVLSVAGGALGILFAVGITKGVVALMPEFYVPNEARITVNGYVLLFSAVVSVLTGILFGLAPALHCSRPDLVEALKEGAKAAGATAGGRTRNLLVIVELALSVILLVGASLTIRGFYQLQHADPGFQPDRVLMVGLPLPPKRYPTYEQRIAFSESVLERVKAIPGVQAAAIGNGGLPFGGPDSAYSIEGHPQAASRRMLVELISAGYLRTMGIPLRAGRELEDREVVRGEHVALINETASKLWPAGENPIGGRLRLDLLEKPGGNVLVRAGSTPYVTVVGIIADTKNAGLRSAPDPAAFVPYTVIAPPGRTLAVRTQGKPLLILNAVRQQVQAVDKDQPVSRPLTLEEALGFETVQPRFNMSLFSFFAAMGLALAVVGIYSVLSYTVARRTHEIGIRIALGAERGAVLGLVLWMGARLVAIGLVAGLAGSYALAKYLRSEVFQVPATDPVAILGVVAVLMAAALLACLVPARRASRLDPMSALRHE